jgi:hypothetical protein
MCARRGAAARFQTSVPLIPLDIEDGYASWQADVELTSLLPPGC